MGERPVKHRTNAIDRHVGVRVRERRKALGLSQQALARALGTTFQQMQKYETGSNRIGAAMLFAIATQLSTSVSWFYEGLPVAEPTPQSTALLREFERMIATREGAILAELFPKISVARFRRAIVDIVQAHLIGGAEP